MSDQAPELTLQTINELNLCLMLQKRSTNDATICISLDATSSGPQCIGALLADFSLMEATNVIGDPNFDLHTPVKDLYGILLEALKNEQLKELSNFDLALMKQHYYTTIEERRVIDHDDYTKALEFDNRKIHFLKEKNAYQPIVSFFLHHFIH